MSRLQKNFSPISPNIGPIPRGTPASSGVRWEFATHFRDRLEVIYGDADPTVLLRLVRRSRNYRELIRRYSNDSML